VRSAGTCVATPPEVSVLSTRDHSNVTRMAHWSLATCVASIAQEAFQCVTY
jgi:hypothetical protein